MRVDEVDRPVEGVAERRLGLVELAAHARVLRALAGEEERDGRGVGGAAAGEDTRRALAAGDGAQAVAQLPTVGAQDHRAVEVARAADVGGVGDVLDRHIGLAVDLLDRLSRELAQSRFGLRRQGEQVERALDG